MKESFDNATQVMRELNSTLSRRENIADTKFNVVMEAICKVGKELTDLAMDVRDKKPVDRRGKLLLLHILACSFLKSEIFSLTTVFELTIMSPFNNRYSAQPPIQLDIWPRRRSEDRY
jgi:hypothetical protein